MHAFENALLLIVLIVGGVFIFVSILLFQKADGILKTPILRKLGAHNATVNYISDRSLQIVKNVREVNIFIIE